jgi:putative hydrolase of the HAD superfamily
MVLKGVTFDWWGTIAVVPSPEETAAMRDLRISRLQELLRADGGDFDRSILYEAYDRQGERLEEAWSQQRELSPEEQVDLFLHFARIGHKDSRFVDTVGDAFGGAILVRPPDLFPHVRETLDFCKEQGLAIGLISNTGRSWGRYLTKLQETLGIAQHFDVRVYSDERRARKPDSGMFAAALAGLGLRPPQVAHIGDDVNADIAVANALGMRTVWFNTGYWAGATTDHADAEISDLRKLPSVLEGWMR